MAATGPIIDTTEIGTVSQITVTGAAQSLRFPIKSFDRIETLFCPDTKEVSVVLPFPVPTIGTRTIWPLTDTSIESAPVETIARVTEFSETRVFPTLIDGTAGTSESNNSIAVDPIPD